MLFEFIYVLPEQNILSQIEGGGAKNIFILACQEPDAEERSSFLTKILAATHTVPERDAHLLWWPVRQPLSLLPVLQDKQPDKVLVFGFTPAEAGLRIEAAFYQPCVFYGTTWLFAEALSVLEPDKVRKMRLWTALKQIFL
jgi:hypothetical protein